MLMIKKTVDITLTKKEWDKIHEFAEIYRDTSFVTNRILLPLDVAESATIAILIKWMIARGGT